MPRSGQNQGIVQIGQLNHADEVASELSGVANQLPYS